MATLRLARLGKSFLEFRIRLDEFNAGHVRPCRLRYILALRFATVDLPQQGFQGCAVAGLERTLVLRVFGYRESGRTATATLGVRQPFCSRGGARSPLVPGLPHRLTPGCGRTFFGDFRLFGVHILLKTMDICGRKVPYVPGVGAQIAGAVPAARVTYSGALQPITSNGHCRRYVEPGLAGSERLCLPAKPCPYLVHALH